MTTQLFHVSPPFHRFEIKFNDGEIVDSLDPDLVQLDYFKMINDENKDHKDAITREFAKSWERNCLHVMRCLALLIVLTPSRFCSARVERKQM